MESRAWSGSGPVERVEFSSDGGRTWEDAELGEPLGPYAWRPWSSASSHAPWFRHH